MSLIEISIAHGETDNDQRGGVNMTRLLRTCRVLALITCLWPVAGAQENTSAVPDRFLTIEAAKARIHTAGAALDRVWNLHSQGDVGDYLFFTEKGHYEIIVRARGSVAGGQWPIAAVKLDDDVVRTFNVASANLGDYRETIEIGPGLHKLTIAFTNDAVIGDEDRNLYLERLTIGGAAGQASPDLGNPAEWTAACEMREQDVLARAAESAEKVRKGDAVIEVRDAAGRAVADASVVVEQIRHDFLFGCNIYMFDRFRTEPDNAEYKRRFADLFNYATTGFYWRWYEPERGKPMYDYTGKVVAWCREHGIRIKGHPLLWGDQAGVPRWSKGQPSAEERKKRVQEIMTRYHGEIEFWEVVNEPSHLREPRIAECYPWAREADSTATLIVNDYEVMANGRPPFLRMLQQAIAQGVPFDGIGIQAHEPRTMRFPLDRSWRILDQYAALGKPLHITEFTPTSAGDPITGWHKTAKWDEATQAEWAERFYRLCFGHPAVVAITWWDLCDRGSWLKGGGMLRSDLSPKPVYDALYRLIHKEWRTTAQGKTDRSGAFSFRGYYGLYRVSVKCADGRATQTDFHLSKDGSSRRALTLPAALSKP
jgi:GH35 family endo-1,4-beta-xylanase